MGTELERVKLSILVSLAFAAAEIAYVLAMAGPTGGASLAYKPMVEAVTRATVRQIVAAAGRRVAARLSEMVSQTMLKRLVPAGMREARQELVLAGLQEATVAGLQGDRYRLDRDRLLLTAVASWVGGGTAGGSAPLVSHALGPAGGQRGAAVKGTTTFFTAGMVGNLGGAATVGGHQDPMLMMISSGTSSIGGVAGGGAAPHGSSETASIPPPPVTPTSPRSTPSPAIAPSSAAADSPGPKWRGHPVEPAAGRDQGAGFKNAPANESDSGIGVARSAASQADQPPPAPIPGTGGPHPSSPYSGDAGDGVSAAHSVPAGDAPVVSSGGAPRIELQPQASPGGHSGSVDPGRSTPHVDTPAVSPAADSDPVIADPLPASTFPDPAAADTSLPAGTQPSGSSATSSAAAWPATATSNPPTRSESGPHPPTPEFTGTDRQVLPDTGPAPPPAETDGSTLALPTDMELSRTDTETLHQSARQGATFGAGQPRAAVDERRLPLPLVPSFYANRVLTSRNGQSVYEHLTNVRNHSRFEHIPVRVGIGIMTTPHTLNSSPSPSLRAVRKIFPRAFKNHWPVGYPDRSQIAEIFRAFQTRTSDEPLLVHIVSGSEKAAYWTKDKYPYWMSKDIPFWESIRSLRELGLRSYDVVRINLADNATWSKDIAEVRRQYPTQRLSLQVHRHDIDSHRDDLSSLAHKVVDVLPHIDEYQIDESLSAGAQADLAVHARLYNLIRTEAEKRGLEPIPCVFSGGVGPESVKSIFTEMLRHCPFAGTDAVGKLQRSTIVGWGGGISPRKSATTLEQYLEAIAQRAETDKRPYRM